MILGLLLANRSMQHTLKLQKQAAALQEENNIARYTALQNPLPNITHPILYRKVPHSWLAGKKRKRLALTIFEWGKRRSEKRVSSFRIGMAEDNLNKVVDRVELEVSVARKALSQAIERVRLSV